MCAERMADKRRIKYIHEGRYVAAGEVESAGTYRRVYEIHPVDPR
jgi:hypothetical protein